jgi:hypothetical protein
MSKSKLDTNQLLHFLRAKSTLSVKGKLCFSRNRWNSMSVLKKSLYLDTFTTRLKPFGTECCHVTYDGEIISAILQEINQVKSG